MYRIITKPARINRLSGKLQYRVVGCYETVSTRGYRCGFTFGNLSKKPRPIGSFYYDQA